MKFYSWIVALMGAAYSPEEVDLFLEGLIIGLVKSDDIDSIKACVKDTSALSADLSMALLEL